MIRKVDKTSEEYGDHIYQVKKDELIEKAYEDVRPCSHCDGWITTNRQHFPTRALASSQQYDILRHSSRIIEGSNICKGLV